MVFRAQAPLRLTCARQQREDKARYRYTALIFTDMPCTYKLDILPLVGIMVASMESET